ncbi:hypothetical protein CRP01_28195 [Flavilitoribacter nigricans DSM 23189 = NBRC 102662]|uniref:Uncharacterized protein n=1 Tax=Flavilitoribacter nigricans (strain ATCC 23147 / DSM 23189 / NBRC 102662 / NCIMB 1420 / SS-2) TaxID=1122177 RepID=A0A2D0N4G7_FLAN2|nr:hypothetical protein CRP01_28195 [Flavilitoribacter nigricans DSM 23189 = NBRC 102662]
MKKIWKKVLLLPSRGNELWFGYRDFPRWAKAEIRNIIVGTLILTAFLLFSIAFFAICFLAGSRPKHHVIILYFLKKLDEK